MNPEFQRQLWLQFSPSRWVMAPALLLLGALPAFFSEESERMAILANLAGAAFLILVLGMGTRAVSASILDELRERTWDQQRMSAMQPWAMTWGKLFGAGAYSWYGGGLCVLIYLPTATAAGHSHPLQAIVSAVLAGVMCHASMLAINLQLSKFGGRLTQRSGIWTLFALGAAGTFIFSNFDLDPRLVSWWGWSFTPTEAMVLSLAVFCLFALISAWRSMAESLAVGQLPWGWPALALGLTAFFGGFATGHHAQLALIGFGVSFALTYAALVSEPQPRTIWQRVLARIELGQWRAALLQLPRWPSTLVLALAFALWLYLTPGNPWHDPVPHLRAEKYAMLSQAPLAAALLLLRDCAIAMFFSVNSHERRPLGAFLVSLLVLYALLPWLAAELSGPLSGQALLNIVLPMAKPGVAGVGIALLHAAAALALLRWRWVNTRATNT